MAATVLLLMMTASGHTQELTWSEPLPWESDDYHTRLIRSVGNGYLLLAQNPYSRQQFAFGAFNSELGLMNTHAFSAPKNSRLQKTLVLQDTVILLFDQKGRDTTKLISQRYHPATDSLYQQRAVAAFPGESTTIHLAKASDSTVNVIALNQAQRQIDYLILGRAKRMLRHTKRPLTDRPNITSINTAIAEGARMAFLAKHATSEALVFYTLDSTAKTLRAQALGSDSTTVTTGSLGYDQLSEQFMAIGLYQLAEGDTYHGVVLLREGAGVDTTRLYSEDFPQQLVRQVFGQNTIKQGLANFQLRSLIPRSDGGAVVFLEAYERDKKVYHDRGYFGTVNETVREYHYYEEVAVTALNPKGKIQWSKVHRKKQTTVNDEGRFSSFSHMIQKKRLIFLYNSINGNTMNLLYYTVTPDGELKGELLLKDRYEQLKPIPRKGTQVGPSGLLMPALQEERLHLLHVDF